MNPAPWILALSNQITTEILARPSWIGIPMPLPDKSPDDNSKKPHPIRLLDYACGEGVISRVTFFTKMVKQIQWLTVCMQGLFNHIDEARGIDLSDQMVKSFNRRAAAFDIPKGKKMFAVQGDLLTPSSSNDDSNSFAGKEWFGFDLTIMSMALHHVASPEDAIKMLVSRLKVGGSVLLIDWIGGTTKFGEGGNEAAACRHGHGGHGHELPGVHTTTRDGFTKDEMVKTLEEVGCVEVEFVEVEQLSYLDFGEKRMWKRLFLAKGVKGQRTEVVKG
ncbi:MAG: hypothetical protein Q9168_004894 [Polycauliona sp. 1 TL-2023]